MAAVTMSTHFVPIPQEALTSKEKFVEERLHLTQEEQQTEYFQTYVNLSFAYSLAKNYQDEEMFKKTYKDLPSTMKTCIEKHIYSLAARNQLPSDGYLGKSPEVYGQELLRAEPSNPIVIEALEYVTLAYFIETYVMLIDLDNCSFMELEAMLVMFLDYKIPDEASSNNKRYISERIDQIVFQIIDKKLPSETKDQLYAALMTRCQLGSPQDVSEFVKLHARDCAVKKLILETINVEKINTLLIHQSLA